MSLNRKTAKGCKETNTQLGMTRCFHCHYHSSCFSLKLTTLFSWSILALSEQKKLTENNSQTLPWRQETLKHAAVTKGNKIMTAEMRFTWDSKSNQLSSANTMQEKLNFSETERSHTLWRFDTTDTAWHKRKKIIDILQSKIPGCWNVWNALISVLKTQLSLYVCT